MTNSGDSRCRRVLLVDDDGLVLRSLARVLRREFEVVTATDASDAIAKISDDLYAVVTDHDLGDGGNGRAILAEARLCVPNARRILISGQLRVPREGERDLWHAMLVKPVSRNDLLAELSVRPSK